MENTQMPQPLMSLAVHVADLLKQSKARIVFAESCTAGLVSATLARVPGISEFHCGSAVVYRLATKTRWLGISEQLLNDPGPVSDEVARAMAEGVLTRTPEADLAVSITGHLGPNAPTDQDGLIFVGFARRTSLGIHVTTFDHILPSQISDRVVTGAESIREWRQWKATETALNHVCEQLQKW